MDATTFTADSPGHLEPTTFTERQWRNDMWDAETVRGHGFVPNPLPPPLELGPLLAELYRPLLEAERALSYLEGAARHAQLPTRHLLIGAFKQIEAIQSSAIEDTFASFEDLALLGQEPARVENPDAAREVANYIPAMEHGFESPLPLCLRLLKEMHAILLRGVDRPGVNPGHFRRSQNIIGGAGSIRDAKFVPPPPEFVDPLMNDLERFINAIDSDWPRLLRIAMVHYQFETIHPFNDGNGRLGRLLITLMLCKQGQLSSPLVYLSGFFERHRSDYYDHLHGVSTRGRWVEWFSFFLRAVATQAGDAAARAERLLSLREEILNRVTGPRASAYVPRVVDLLFGTPAITAATIQKRLDCSPQTAANLVERFVDQRVLREVTGRGRDRVYVAERIVQLMQA